MEIHCLLAGILAIDSAIRTIIERETKIHNSLLKMTSELLKDFKILGSKLEPFQNESLNDGTAITSILEPILDSLVIRANPKSKSATKY